MDFYVGQFLNLNDEETGEVTHVTATEIFIKSPSFQGWATKEEISAAAIRE